MSCVSHRCMKWCTIIGLALINMPLSFEFYWGNLTVYINSYVAKYCDSEIAEEPWVNSLACVSHFLAMFITGFVLKRFHNLLAIMGIGTVISLIGLTAAYFTLQSCWPMAMDIFLGLFFGVGRCVSYSVSLVYVLQWSEQDAGMLFSLLDSCFAVGAMMINQITTLYVNPNNLLPDTLIGSSRYFFEPEIVDRVPDLLLILGSVVLSFSIIGMFMIRENNKEGKEQTIIMDEVKTPGKDYGTAMQTDECHGGLQRDAVTNSENTRSIPNNQDFNQPDHRELKKGIAAKGNLDCLQVQEISENNHDLSSCQALRTGSLYFLWMFYIFGTFMYIISSAYYKLYGQLYIRDDHFLTNVSTALLVGIMVARLIVGQLLDRHTLKTTFVSCLSISALCSLLFYFSPLISQWCYVTMTAVFGGFGTIFNVILSYTCKKKFGETNYLYNFTLIYAPSVLLSITFPSIFKSIMATAGWFGVYATCSCCNLIALVVVFVGLSDDKWD